MLIRCRFALNVYPVSVIGSVLNIMKARFVGFLSKFVTNLMRSVLVGGFRTTDGVGVSFCEKAIQNVKF